MNLWSHIPCREFRGLIMVNLDQFDVSISQFFLEKYFVQHITN